MQLTLIRHLPTEWNKKTWLQGRQDIEISEITEAVNKEITENQLLLEKLSPFTHVLASSLRRTHQTARLYGYKYEIESLLDELDFGAYEGVPKTDMINEFGEKWRQSPKEIVLGESIENLEKRIVLFLEKYRKSSNILAFGHGSWIRAAISYNQYGHVNNMNKITIENNECITVTF
ncbi:histidine phosphatase family protein [Paenibacillus sp. BSR1-1]|uniref:histidine phosphatase family protein n=1 Tax=Paenibacillus sp. BSR1-1 TaxID=3020845 RepID=UPI0025B05981|nr:histidine phosphatase family protein [Paenibacillus sp. BSR1-1]MDN3017009.1 histidine phosphatase family protein [Paenibacillus sp. BSR1-1]